MSEDTNYLARPLNEFLTDLGSRTPTPGGGSTAALVGALSAALARMTVAYSAGKETFAEYADRHAALLDELAETVDAMGELIAEDMAAYRQYAAARRSDAAARRGALERAIAVPMAIIDRTVALAARFDEFKEITNRYLLSDLAAAAELDLSAGRAAATSVRTNLAALNEDDPAEAVRIGKQLDASLARLARHRDAVARFQAAH